MVLSRSGCVAAVAAVLLSVVPPAEAFADEPTAAPPGPFALTGTLQDRFDAVTNNHVDLEHAVQLKDVVVDDRYLRLVIEDATAAPVRLASGPVIGVWFKGTCSVSYRPPPGQEADAFERGTGRPSLSDHGCTEGYLLTDDDEVLGALGFAADDRETSAVVQTEWLRRFRRRSEIWKSDGRFHNSFAVSALRQSLVSSSGRDAGFGTLDVSLRMDPFGSPAWTEDAEPLDRFWYARYPGGLLASHEIVLTSAASAGGLADTHYRTLLTSHPWEGDPDTAFVPANLDMVSAEIDLDIEVGLRDWAEMTAVATVTLTTREAAADVVELRLLKDQSFKRWFGTKERLGFDVSSVEDYKQRPLDFLHQGGRLIVRLRSPVAPGQAEILTIRYAGNAMPRVGDNSFGLLANYPWWPSPGNHDRLTWKLNLCVPKSFQAVGTGAVLSSEIRDGKRCERWEETVPITFPAVNLGRWKTAEREDPHGVRVRAFFLSEDENRIEAGLEETLRVLEFYEQIFGPYPYSELDLAQSYDNMGFWQAPAGLVEFSRSRLVVRRTLSKDLRSDYYPHDSIATLAHEIAHQWWGHVVGWKTYRDQWVSETFAEYASFLYMASHYGEESYLGRLEYWEAGARRSDPYGPAVLGSRTGRGYVGQVYCRGPYILHMLRRLVGDEAFTEFTSTLATFVANRNVSTADVVAVARQVLGPDVDWFFDQWLFRTGLPDLEATWRVEGRKVHVTIRQVQDGPAFRLQVPLQLKGKKRSSQLHLVAMDSNEVTVELPLPPGGVVKALLLDPDREILTAGKKVKKAAE